MDEETGFWGKILVIQIQWIVFRFWMQVDMVHILPLRAEIKPKDMFTSAVVDIVMETATWSRSAQDLCLCSSPVPTSAFVAPCMVCLMLWLCWPSVGCLALRYCLGRCWIQQGISHLDCTLHTSTLLLLNTCFHKFSLSFYSPDVLIYVGCDNRIPAWTEWLINNLEIYFLVLECGSQKSRLVDSVSLKGLPLVHRGLSSCCVLHLVEGQRSSLGSLVKHPNLSWELFALLTIHFFRNRITKHHHAGDSVSNVWILWGTQHWIYSTRVRKLHSAGKIQPPAYFVNFIANTAILVYIAYGRLLCCTGRIEQVSWSANWCYYLAMSLQSLRLLKTPLLFLPDWVTNHVNFKLRKQDTTWNLKIYC